MFVCIGIVFGIGMYGNEYYNLNCFKTRNYIILGF